MKDTKKLGIILFIVIAVFILLCLFGYYSSR
jgi:NADH:ubiquinone oxidoreductase subunit 3 (subunit A)